MYTIIDRRIILFGTFELSESIVNKVAENFKDAKVAMGKDQEGNIAARLQGANFMIEMTRGRVLYVAGVKDNAQAKEVIFKMVDDLSLVVDAIKDYGINRLAFNSQAFLKDLDGAKRVLLGSRVQLLKTDSPMIETSVRLNYRENIMGEEINNVISIQDGTVRSKDNENEPMRALIMLSDINTLANNTQVRFDKNHFETMFGQMQVLADKSFEDLDEELM
ncbi:MAG: hypothetical protein J1F31_05735 [Erysipelotrichales bacterium]|nr:hypothetical protein [Erysipelotrichales bacterium]